MSISAKTFTEVEVSYGNIPTKVDFLAEILISSAFYKKENKWKNYFL